MAAIGDHHKNGYRMTLLIESRPDDFYKFLYSRGGHMIIHDMYSYYAKDIKEDLYSQYGDNVYTLTDKEGVDKNITYTNVQGDAYWPRVCRHIKTEVGDRIKIVIRNNGQESVRIGIHAGIFNDERSDSEKNQMFFPLYQNQGRNEEGYFKDGNTVDIEGNDECEVIASVDESSEFGVDYNNDTFDVIQFLIDNCYGDTKTRSGDIDIVSIDII